MNYFDGDCYHILVFTFLFECNHIQFEGYRQNYSVCGRMGILIMQILVLVIRSQKYISRYFFFINVGIREIRYFSDISANHPLL